MYLFDSNLQISSPLRFQHSFIFIWEPRQFQSVWQEVSNTQISYYLTFFQTYGNNNLLFQTIWKPSDYGMALY